MRRSVPGLAAGGVTRGEGATIASAFPRYSHVHFPTNHSPARVGAKRAAPDDPWCVGPVGVPKGGFGQGALSGAAHAARPNNDWLKGLCEAGRKMITHDIRRQQADPRALALHFFGANPPHRVEAFAHSLFLKRKCSTNSRRRRRSNLLRCRHITGGHGAALSNLQEPPRPWLRALPG
jgi:hypothetical protein